MATIRTTCNPKMLIWARDEIGYTQEQAAQAIGVSLLNLQAAELGDHQLTLQQLRKAADVYQFPFGYFYLSKPAHKKSYKPVPDYRTDVSFAGVPHFRLNLEIKKCRDRRKIYLDLAKSMDITIDQFRVIKSGFKKNIGSHIRQRLDINPIEIDKKPFDQIYSYWKSKIENDGVLVYETQYIPEQTGVIGASLFYNTAPIILIRRGKSNNIRKLFTLLHEYSHLLLGISALNDKNSLNVTASGNNKDDNESKCNQLAAQILIPLETIKIESYKNLEPEDMMTSLGNEYKVSYSTAAIYLRRINLIQERDLSELLRARQERHEKLSQRKKTGGGEIPRENIMRLDLGRPLFNLVLSAYNNGHLDLYDSSKLLHLRTHKIEKLISRTN